MPTQGELRAYGSLMRADANKVLMVAAGTKVVSGLVLIDRPSFLTRLVFGGEKDRPGRGGA